MIYNQIPIRLGLSILSNTPIDANTGQPPKFFRGQALALQVGIFDADNVAVDLTNLQSMTFVLQQAEDSAVALVTKQILAETITPTIARDAWLNGSVQQAQFVLSNAETDQSLAGLTEATLWMLIYGTNAAGQRIIYAAGPCVLHAPGSTLPPRPYGYVSRHAQTMDVDNATIAPASLQHTEIVTIEGAARTTSLILGTTGIADGALLHLRLELPATPDIILNIRSGLISSDIISTITTGSALNALFVYSYNETAAAWEPIAYLYPAT